MVDLLYTTDKRRGLANWFRDAYSGSSYQDIKVSKAPIEIQDIIKEVKLNEGSKTVSGEFVNQRFPCWTGTLTCFMLTDGNRANQILSLPADKRTQDECWKYKYNNGKTSVDIRGKSTSAQQKIIHVLFLLELIDNWEDVQKITDIKKDAPTKDQGYDPYACVPVPNTAYIYKQDRKKKHYQGSCMVSTIRNLLCILCRNTPKSTEIKTNKMSTEMQEAFKECDFYTVPGTTSCETLRAFADAMSLNIAKEYRPTLDLFVCTLNGLLSKAEREAIQIQIPTPDKYLSGSIHRDLIESILRKLTGHKDIAVTFTQWPIRGRDGKKAITGKTNWPEYQLIITDPVVRKKITIGLGHSGGGGQHIEIIDIQSYKA